MNWTPVIGLVLDRAIDAVADGFRRKPSAPPVINPEDYVPRYDTGIGVGETRPSIPVQEAAGTAAQDVSGASLAPGVTRPQQIRKTSRGKECRPCTADHLGTCAGLLSEAVRFARADGVDNNEVQERLALCTQEMNAWERWDAAPKSFVDLSDEDKSFLRRWLPKGRGFRHKVNEVESVEDLEQAAAAAQRLHLEARKEIKALRPAAKSPLAERFEAEMGEQFEERSSHALLGRSNQPDSRAPFRVSPESPAQPTALSGPIANHDPPEELRYFADTEEDIARSMAPFRENLLQAVTERFRR